ncbi:MAG: metallophosphoesterase [Sphingomonadaceae bacterium]|nr:metallophosphoesterase [Sphingomonadaceae bacterium]
MKRLFIFFAILVMLGFLALGVGYRNAIADPAVRRVTILMPAWPVGAPAMRVVLVADIHLGNAVTGASRLAHIVDLINPLSPDLVLIAGDFVAGHERAPGQESAAALAAPLARLKARFGVVATLGNHDHWTAPDEIADALTRANITVLENTAAVRGPLVIGGVGDAFTRHDQLGRTRAAMRGLAGVPLILTHSPDIAPDLDPDVRLLLAGHTHCGQIVLPFVGAISTVSRFGERYRCGIRRERGHIILVTAGVGTSVLPLRYGAPPDIWLIELRGR